MSINLDKRFSVTIVRMIVPRILEFVKAKKRFGKVSVSCQEGENFVKRDEVRTEFSKCYVTIILLFEEGRNFLNRDMFFRRITD
jgi:hypothetical protein